MEEQEESEIIEQPVSEESIDVAEEEVSSEPKQVPLTALQAERRKRQDLEAQNRLYADYIERMKSENEAQVLEEDEDPERLLDMKEFKSQQALTKREIREEVYKDMNPKAMAQVKKYLDQILEKKPWLADSIKSSENRYARAAEIVEDYQHLVETKKNYATGNEGAKIVANANKPGSPITVAKAAPTSNSAYLKSIQGTPAFREYRQKVMRGEL